MRGVEALFVLVAVVSGARTATSATDAEWMADAVEPGNGKTILQQWKLSCHKKLKGRDLSSCDVDSCVWRRGRMTLCRCEGGELDIANPSGACKKTTASSQRNQMCVKGKHGAAANLAMLGVKKCLITWITKQANAVELGVKSMGSDKNKLAVQEAPTDARASLKDTKVAVVRAALQKAQTRAKLAQVKAATSKAKAEAATSKAASAKKLADASLTHGPTGTVGATGTTGGATGGATGGPTGTVGATGATGGATAGATGMEADVLESLLKDEEKMRTSVKAAEVSSDKQEIDFEAVQRKTAKDKAEVSATVAKFAKFTDDGPAAKYSDDHDATSYHCLNPNATGPTCCKDSCPYASEGNCVKCSSASATCKDGSKMPRCKHAPKASLLEYADLVRAAAASL